MHFVKDLIVVDLERDVHRAHEIRQEDEAAVEHADHERTPTRVVVGQRGCQLADALRDVVLVEEHVADAGAQAPFLIVHRARSIASRG